MDRRAFIGTLAAGLVAAPLAATAQPAGKVWRVGLSVTNPALRDALVAGLQELGYQEGRNIAIYWQKGSAGDTRSIEDLVRLKPDCLVLPGELRWVLGRRLTSTIPIITIDLESDPVASGFVASFARPVGNVTGIFVDLPELAGKVIQILREAIPALTRLAVLWDERQGDAQLRAAQSGAKATGTSLFPIAIRADADLDHAVSRAMRSRPQALLVLSGPVIYVDRARIVESAVRNRLPSASVQPELAEAGGLIGYGPNLAEQFRQAARYIDRLVKGARPADLPIERPNRFQLVINLKTAKALGLTIPPSLLQRADQVIE
jgi:putative ABC transport system substrate-binding protein